MKTVFVVCVKGRFLSVCKTEELANKKALEYKRRYANKCEVFEKELHEEIELCPKCGGKLTHARYVTSAGIVCFRCKDNEREIK